MTPDQDGGEHTSLRGFLEARAASGSEIMYSGSLSGLPLNSEMGGGVLCGVETSFLFISN